jgi:hypothetical protein
MGRRQTRIRARELWQQGWLIEEISSELGVKIDTLQTWVRDIEFTEEQEAFLAETKPEWYKRYRRGLPNKQRGLKRRLAYQEAGREKAKEGSLLHLMATMLYWGEGSKSINDMGFVNTDPHMLKLYMRFLREEMKVENEIIRITVIHHTTDEQEIARMIQYWLDWLELPATTKVFTQLKIGTTSRKKRYINGMCVISVHRTELVQQIFGAIQEYVGIDKPEWGK